LFRFISVYFGLTETPKLAVSLWKRNNRNKRFVSDSAETGFGSSFGCFESKLVSKDTLFPSTTALTVPALIERPYTVAGKPAVAGELTVPDFSNVVGSLPCYYL
jgi:hypothetical protein